MLRLAAQRIGGTLLRQQACAAASGATVESAVALWTSQCTRQCVQPVSAFAVHPFQTSASPCQSQPERVAEARGEYDEPQTDMKMNKNAGKSDEAKTFDKGHIEPDMQAKADGAEEKISARGYLLSSPTYTKEYVESIAPKHKKPEKFFQTTGLYAVSIMRWSFDKITGYGPNMNEAKWMTRILFLETVAGVPGMVGAMLRHLRSLRSLKRDHGWIHTLLEEAENERMHLLTFLALKQPNFFFRAFVLGAQGVFFNLYTLFYMMSPRHCHAFVGYLEEEAVKTYTHCLSDIDSGKLEVWRNKKAPEIAINYWNLDADATMRDVVLAVRADEASHSHVNHTFSEMQAMEKNPFAAEDSQIIP